MSHTADSNAKEVALMVEELGLSEEVYFYNILAYIPNEQDYASLYPRKTNTWDIDNIFLLHFQSLFTDI